MTTDDGRVPEATGESSPGRKWVGKLLLFVTSLGLSLLLADFILRELNPQADNKQASVYAPDARLLYRMVPGTSKIFRHKPENGSAEVHVRVNKHGFRGDDFALETQQPRIVVYGDSFIAGEFSPLEETFVERLEDRLSQALGREVECINAGVVGYGPDQMLLRMEEDSDKLMPDLIVVALFSGNDYGDIVRNRLFGLNADGSLRAQKVSFSQTWIDSWAQADEGGLLDTLSAHRKAKTSRSDEGVANLSPQEFMKRALRNSKRDHARALASKVVVLNSVQADYYDADLAISAQKDSSRYKLQLMEQVMLEFERRASARGIPLVFVGIPAPMDVCEGYEVSVDPSIWPSYEPDRLCRGLADIARRNDLWHVDLFPSFHGDACASMFFGNGDHHWTAAGQDLAATTVAQSIVAHGWP